MLTAEVIEALKPYPGTLFITIGNALRSDDGAGVYIGEQVPGVLNAYDKPENVIDEAVAKKPKRVIIIDAADFNGTPGEARILAEELIPKTTLTTHAFPIPVLTRILAKDTGCEVIFIGIQINSAGLKEGLSPEVKETAEEIIKCMKCT